MQSLKRRDTLPEAISDYVARLNTKLAHYIDDEHDLILLSYATEGDARLLPSAFAFIRSIVFSAEAIAIVHGAALERSGHERILLALPAILDKANHILSSIEACVASIDG